MKYLIPYLQGDLKAAAYLRQLRWPDGVRCPRCGSDAVESCKGCDSGLQRFNCVPYAVRSGQQLAMFADWTSSSFEESKLTSLAWLLVIGLWQLKRNASEIAAAADIQERTAQRCIHSLDGGIYETYHLDPTRQTVNHGAGEYARRDPDGTCVHGNTLEGMWSDLCNFLDRFKGISQCFLHLRVARYEFLHNYKHLNWRQTFEAVLRSIFSTPGDYLRRMARQHRRMPLTLCYR